MEFTKVQSDDETINMLQNNIETTINNFKNEVSKLNFNINKMTQEIKKLNTNMEENKNNITLVEDRVRSLEDV